MNERWDGNKTEEIVPLTEDERTAIKDAVLTFFKEGHPRKAFYLDQYVYASTGKTIAGNQTKELLELYKDILDITDINDLKLKQ